MHDYDKCLDVTFLDHDPPLPLRVRDLDEKKPLSLLCRSFADISHYTGGFPAANVPGQPNWFNVVRKILPGPVRMVQDKLGGVVVV